MHSYTLNEVFHMAAIRASKKAALGASKFTALRAMHFPAQSLYSRKLNKGAGWDKKNQLDAKVYYCKNKKQ